MDLINTGEEQQQQQQRTSLTGCTPFIVGEKPGTAASSDAMSRPSLISSLWSIQVQNEGSASDFPMMEGCGSQQSLPEMVVAGGGGTCSSNFQNGYSGNLGGCETSTNAERTDLASRAIIPMEMQNRTGGQQQPSLRPAKSLSDLRPLTSAQATAIMPYHHQHIHADQNDQYIHSFRRLTETGAYYNMLSRQQRDSQICEWLQKLNVNSGGAETSGSESPSQEFYQQQQRPLFQRADTTDQ
uniref:Uncharacterized protein n=1 Tax=Meloidogyne enterolobii TaxID=390850 RepID=A0A6V7XBH2_MELEN|nr:unnamed protein product [Meloidogyne enterolobii]CAD2196689.1 unnamed protein product [Meloidogyne enterolobii]